MSSRAYFFTAQTHKTPVLLGFKDRAELAGRDIQAATTVIEGVVVVEKASESEEQAAAATTTASK